MLQSWNVKRITRDSTVFVIRKVVIKVRMKKMKRNGNVICMQTVKETLLLITLTD